MSKQVEVPPGVNVVEVAAPGGALVEMIRVSDLGAIYKHFSDRLLFELKYEKGPYTIEQVEAALQATSTPEVDRGE